MSDFTAICITRMSSPVWRICPTMRSSRRRRWPNRMLDMLPEELWHDSSATFLEIIIPSLIQGMGKIKKCALAV